MGLFTKTAEQVRAKELKDELKILRKELVSSGMEKSRADARVKELRDIMEGAMISILEYQNAREHLILADAAIPELLSYIDNNEIRKLKSKLLVLIEDLEQFFNDCLIQKGDLDFVSTVEYLKRISGKRIKPKMNEDGTFVSQEMRMLRSELENAKAVIEDVVRRSVPDFMAFSFYMLHEKQSGSESTGKTRIQEMENEQRNAFLTEYFDKYYRKEFLEEMEHFGMKQRIAELQKEYIGSIEKDEKKV